MKDSTKAILETLKGHKNRLTTNTFEQDPLDWSRDGRFLLYTQIM
jgi:hypothetical protein